MNNLLRIICIVLLSLSASAYAGISLPNADTITTKVLAGTPPYSYGNDLFDFWVPVGDGHRVYVSVSGNPNGVPVVFMHGGPGGGTSADYKKFFNPEKYYVILVDQRGAGKSYQENNDILYHNTTQDLVSDFEKVRQALKIDQWVVFGGSWGSTLALLYAEQFPEHALGMVVRGIYLATPNETEMLYGETASKLYPVLWQRFVSYLPASDRQKPVEAYFAMMQSKDDKQRRLATFAAVEYERALMRAVIDVAPLKISDEELDAASKGMLIEFYYISNNMFMTTPNYIVENIAKIQSLPTIIVQGLEDHITSPNTATLLHAAFPSSMLVMIPNSGHTADKGITESTIAALDMLVTNEKLWQERASTVLDVL